MNYALTYPFRAVTSVCLALALAACSSTSPTPAKNPPATTPTTGILEVSITGVPANATPNVTITGPSNYAAVLNKSQALTVKPGQYTFQAQDLNIGGQLYTAAVSGNPASVTAGQKTNVTVAYAMEAGTITSFSATPSAVNSSGGQVTLSWGGRNISAYTLTLKSGSGVNGLPSGNTSATSATVTLPANTSTRAVTYTFELSALPMGGTLITRTLEVTVASVSTGTLGVNVKGLPQGTAADINVTGPDGFQKALTAQQTLPDLAPGVYSVSAQEVSAKGLRYKPTVTNSPLQVSAGKGVQATVTYEALPVTVSITPKEVTLDSEGNQTFTASVTGAADEGIAWTASSGTIEGSGKTASYLAPVLAGTYTVTATSTADPTKSVTANVTVRGSMNREWTQRLGSAFMQSATSVALAPNGVVVAGSADGEATPDDPDHNGVNFIARFNAGGQRVWWRQFGEQGGVRIGTDSQGNVYAIGSGSLRKYEPDGSLVYDKTFASLAGPGNPERLAVAANGSLYLTYRVDDTSRTFLEMRNPDGTLVWKKDFAAGVNARATDVAVLSDDLVYVIGGVSGNLDLGGETPLGGQDAFLVQYRARDGHQNWVRRMGTSADEDAGLVTVNTAGDAHLITRTVTASGTSQMLVKVTRQNDVSWSLSTPSDMHVTSLAAGPDGTVFLAGVADDPAPWDGLMLSKHNVRGQRTWATPSTGGNDTMVTARDVVVDPQGNAYLAGSSARNESSAFVTRFSPDTRP